MPNPKGFIRALTGLFLLAALLAASLTPAQAAQHQAVAPGDVVISEFRTRGPSGISDEFIELYNRTTSQVDINGWSLKESDVLGGTINTLVTITVPTVLQSGQYYLIANSGSGGYAGTGTAAPDLTYPSGGIPDNGGIALFEADGITISDQVGMDVGSLYQEPPVLAPQVNPNQSYERSPGGTQGGCTDSDRNGSDFSLITITPADPQDTGSTPGTCNAAPASTFTPTPSSTPTRTPTHTPLVCPSATPTAYTSLALIINEVAWSGTVNNQSDQWVEIHNPGPCPISLSGWYLQAKISGSSQFIISLADAPTTPDTILPGGYFVLASSSSVFKSSGIINQATSTLILQRTFSTPGESLLLFGPNNELVDHANFNGDAWPAGSQFGRGSMERGGVLQDVPSNWITYAGPTTGILDSGNYYVRGTPGQANWAYGVTITPIPVKTPTKKPTQRPPTPFAHVVINEYLPRPGFDWNNDGEINVYDEFIEIENLGPINVSLSGWKLDNVAGGSHFYSLPAKTLKPGERALYYGSVSKIPLLDSGGTVRLLNNRGIVVDARGYGIATEADVSHCRIPDGDGYWRDSCFPTPNTENALTGTEPSLPPAVANKPPACLLPDTVPDPFREAVCNAFGGDILNGGLWDELAGQKIFPVLDNYNKSQTTIQ